MSGEYKIFYMTCTYWWIQAYEKSKCTSATKIKYNLINRGGLHDWGKEMWNQ